MPLLPRTTASVTLDSPLLRDPITFGDEPSDEPRRQLPETLRLLCTSAVAPSWVGIALRLDAAGCQLPRLHHEATTAAALARLRERPFDVVLIVEPQPIGLAATAVPAMRTAGVEEPIVAVRTVADDVFAVLACEHDVEVLVTSHPWDSPAIVPAIARVLERRSMREEHERLLAERTRRDDRDRDEAERILGQQQRIIADLAALADQPIDDAPSDVRATLNETIGGHYRDLLRTHVIMGSGRLGTEVTRLAAMLAEAGIGPRQALEMHLAQVAEIVRGLGNRSTRHVVARADLLALELVVQVGEYLRSRAGR